MRTKWEIQEARMVKAREEYFALRAELMGLENTPFGYGNDKCSSCGALLDTEAAFAKHYLVDDERYLNIGNCPTRYNNGKLMYPKMGVFGSKTAEELAYEDNELHDAVVLNRFTRKRNDA